MIEFYLEFCYELGAFLLGTWLLNKDKVRTNLKGATTESQCSQRVTKKTLGTTRAGRPSKMAPTVYEDDKVLDEMDMSGSEEIDQGESLFTKKKKNQKRKASTPKKQRQVNLDSSVDVSPVKTPRKPTTKYQLIQETGSYFDIITCMQYKCSFLRKGNL